MLKWEDKSTVSSMRLLTLVAREKKRPIILWIGAGVSKWCDYPLWNEVADIFHSDFLRYEPTFEASVATQQRTHGLPDFFGYCKNISPQRYNVILQDIFRSKKTPPVYNRFIKLLQRIAPLQIITTNVDESLEHNLREINTVQISDIERIPELTNNATPFIFKIHGSISAINSLIFTKKDYERIQTEKFLKLLQHTLSSSTIVFLGYSIGDEYILNLLQQNYKIKDLFGDGPHFVITHEKKPLPAYIHQIIYAPEPHHDHRNSLMVLENIVAQGSLRSTAFTIEQNKESVREKPRSAYFISDVIPPGEWQSAQTFGLDPVDDPSKPALITHVGLGITNEELPNTLSSAAHDMAIGLLCFDEVIIPLASAPMVFQMFGDALFLNLINEKILHFVYWNEADAVTFTRDKAQGVGSIGLVTNMSANTIDQQIRRMFKPVPGKEDIHEKNLDKIKVATEFIDDQRIPSIPSYIQGLLVYPNIKQALGISEATSPKSVPEWMIYPTLRLAKVVRVGLSCELLKIPSTKLLFGTSGLAGPVFPACSGRWWVDDMAGYIVSGGFDTHLGELFIKNPALFKTLLRFRDTEEGHKFRKEIFDLLQTNNGAEISASVNGSLKDMISKDVLERAKSKMAGLLTANKATQLIKSVWNNAEYDAEAMRRWKLKSRKNYEEYCRKHKIKPNDPCPCESGEKRRFCCDVALFA